LNVNGFTFIAIAACSLAVLLLYRRITIVNRLSKLILAVVIADVVWVIFAGVSHFNSSMAFDFPRNAFDLSPNFFLGLGSAMLLSIYDYLGYYNICFLGDEVKEPSKTVPKTIIISVALVGVIYIVMNISILGVIPWQELVKGANSRESHYVISLMMQKLYGSWAGSLATLLIMWTAFGSVFSLLLGYSRVPYAAAIDGNFFNIFGRVHHKHKFPYVSLLTLGCVGLLFCFLSLANVIAALVVIRIIIQFLSQTVGLIVWHRREPHAKRPFRMWLYPLPALISLAGFTFILLSRKNFTFEVRYAAIILVIGIIVYFIRALEKKDWPFTSAPSKRVT
jgi:amino acid transporter